MSEGRRDEGRVCRILVVRGGSGGELEALQMPQELSVGAVRCKVKASPCWASPRADIVLFGRVEAANVEPILRWVVAQLADAPPGTVATIGKVYAVRLDSDWSEAYVSWRTRAASRAGRVVSDAVLREWPTSSPQLIASIRQIDSITDLWPRILIVGETGTGKTRLAEVIHRCLPQTVKDRLVVVSPAIACVDIAPAEIFGHVRGAFTGATSDRDGRCVKAIRGTLLLDDVDVYPRSVQASLLRFVDEGLFQKVGDREERKAKCVIIATASSELEQLVRQGKFRRDFYERLRGLVLFIPPLRARPEDIPYYAERFLRGRLGMGEDAVQRLLGDEVIDRLLTHNWRGNLRELEHVILELVRRCGSRRTAKRKHADAAIRAVSLKATQKMEDDDLSKIDEYPIEYDRASYLGEAHAVKVALYAVRGNVSRASERLKVSRSYLYELIARYGIDLESLRAG